MDQVDELTELASKLVDEKHPRLNRRKREALIDEHTEGMLGSINSKLLQQLSDADFKAFEPIMRSGDDAAMQAFFVRRIPNVQELTVQALTEYVAEQL